MGEGDIFMQVLFSSLFFFISYFFNTKRKSCVLELRPFEVAMWEYRRNMPPHCGEGCVCGEGCGGVFVVVLRPNNILGPISMGTDL